MRRLVLGIALAVGTVFAAHAQGQEVALVKARDGAVFTVRGADRAALDVGQPIFLKDIVETADGTVGLTFKDGTRISLGPNSRIEFKEFQFAPAEDKLSFLVGLMRGTMLYISGVIAKLAPESVRIETPVATVAVRGTRFLASIEGN